MPFGQLVIGSPGSGKTTYCDGLHQFLSALGRPISIVNLDPANGRSLPYPCAINIADLITVKDVMREEGLGPNGAMLYCIEYLEENYDWLAARLEALGDDAYVAFDLPGQVELSTNHGSLRRILERLQKRDWRLVAVHLLDASHITDASRYISLLLLSLRAMLTLELPHVNVLSKVDLLGDAAASAVRSGSESGLGDDEDDDEDMAETSSAGHVQAEKQGAVGRSGLTFNLDYYTEVQDLSYLVEHLNTSMGPRRAERFGELNARICEMVEDFGLVSFETLAVEDKRSMVRLQRVLDKATGYIYVGNSEGDEGQDGMNDPIRSGPATENQQAGAEHLRDVRMPDRSDIRSSAHEPQPGTQRGTAATAGALFGSADRGAPPGWGSAADVQERWVDHPEAWEEIEIKERNEVMQRWRKQQQQEAGAGDGTLSADQEGRQRKAEKEASVGPVVEHA